MCGRYAFTLPPDAIRQLFGVADGEWVQPRHNISPSSTSPVIRMSDGKRELVPMKWGLRPFWWDPTKTKNQPFNAPAEDVSSKPFFRDAFKHRRCVVPATAYYEWDRLPKPPKPYQLTVDGGAPFCFAGLWERWKSPEGEAMETYAIVTTHPNKLVSNWHNRMPVIFDREEIDSWLAQSDRMLLEAMLDPFPAHRMDAKAVSTKINNSAYEGPA
ncbi:MAG: SOS response-associated peptidase [Dongiaceae bacterium]